MGTNAVPKVHPKPTGKMVEIYLGRTVRGASIDGPGNPELRVGINDYQFDLKMGQRNVVPYEVYQQLLNSRSQTKVPDVERAERAPRPAGMGYTKLETICDYEVELIKEDV